MDINITLPDNSVRKFNNEVSGYDLASDIGRSLAKDAVCIEINGQLNDLNTLIKEDSRCRIFTSNDQTSLDVLRHSSAHILAQAVLNLFPSTQYGVGPSIDDGFYYDFLFENNIKEEDLLKIEEEMHKIVQQKQNFSKEFISDKEALKLFPNQQFKQELINTADKDEGVNGEKVSIYKNGEFIDLCSFALYILRDVKCVGGLMRNMVIVFGINTLVLFTHNYKCRKIFINLVVLLILLLPYRV